MGILDFLGKKDSNPKTTNGPKFSVSTELVPYKLHSKTTNSAMLNVKVRNLTKEVLLTSIVVSVAGKIGFDEMGRQNTKEQRLGEMQPGEVKETKFNIYANLGTDAGNYTVTLDTFAHYRDYTHVLDSVRKDVQIGVI